MHNLCTTTTEVDMLPPEIIDHILGFLQRDRHTLEVCADAYPSLSKLVERHLYHHLTVQNFGHPLYGTYDHCDLLKRIVDNPNIAKQVRSLRLEVDFFRDYRALESILPMVTQLRVISLSSKSTSLSWRHSFRTAFENCLRLPTLTHVELANVNPFPLSALDHSSSLTGLSLWGNFSNLPPSSPLVYPPLDFFDLHCCSSGSMEIITSWVESRGLPVRSLELSSSLDQSSRLLGVCANTLTTLIVRVPLNDIPSDDPTLIPLSLSCLPQLARLTVQTPIVSAVRPTVSSLPTTMHLLDTLPSTPTNLVLLVIKVDITINPFSGLDDISDMDWSPLISFPHFNVIPRVELQVQVQKSRTYFPSVELLKTLKQNPQLMQLEVHESFLINAVEKPVDWVDLQFDRWKFS